MPFQNEDEPAALASDWLRLTELAVRVVVCNGYTYLFHVVLTGFLLFTHLGDFCVDQSVYTEWGLSSL